LIKLGYGSVRTGDAMRLGGAETWCPRRRCFQARAVEPFGYDVVVATNGVAALTVFAASEGEVDVVVTDLAHWTGSR
jgi:hypothetical protein